VGEEFSRGFSPSFGRGVLPAPFRVQRKIRTLLCTMNFWERSCLGPEQYLHITLLFAGTHQNIVANNAGSRRSCSLFESGRGSACARAGRSAKPIPQFAPRALPVNTLISGKNSRSLILTCLTGTGGRPARPATRANTSAMATSSHGLNDGVAILRSDLSRCRAPSGPDRAPTCWNAPPPCRPGPGTRPPDRRYPERDIG
jgi:hypothetical protein